MIFSENCLRDKRILITGASSGIGRATARRLAACGAVLCLSGRDTERLDETRQSLQGNAHICLPFDIQDADTFTDMLSSTSRTFGSFHGIFHAAGSSMVRPIKLSKEKQFHEVYASSVVPAIALARAASLRGVMNDGGVIVLMSSVAAVRGQSGMALYSSAKAAIEGMTRSLAVEFAPRSIRVNAISAGAVQTEMHVRLTENMTSESLDTYRNKHLLGFGKADDIANAVVYLMAETGEWITGSTLTVDGGYAAK